MQKLFSVIPENFKLLKSNHHEIDEKYMIGCYGTIKSIDRNVKHKNGKTFQLKGRVLKPTKTNSGYLQINLTQNHHRFYVHRLVAQYFIGHLNEGLQVNHLDGNKLNNRAENLQICTPSENVIHSYEKLNHTKHNLRLDRETAQSIRFEYSKGKISQKALAQKYGVSVMVVNRIINKIQQFYK